VTGSHSFYWQTNSPQIAGAWFIGLLLSPTLTPPIVITVGVTTLVFGADVVLMGRLVDLDNQGTVSIFFQWGRLMSLGNETTHSSASAPVDFSASLTLALATTYFFRACASNSTTTFCGSTLSFHTGFDVAGLLGLIVFLVFITAAGVLLYNMSNRKIGKKEGGV